MNSRAARAIAFAGLVFTGCGGGDGVDPLPSVRTVTLASTGTGTGTVTSSPAGINCGSTCTASLSATAAIALTAAPAANSQFVSWSGACSGTSTSCTVPSGTSAVSATARFDLVTFLLTTTLAGTGTGTVTSAPAGITCGTDCTEAYATGTVVTLTAAAAVGSTFTGWSGSGCTGTGTCAVTMSQAATVTATFTPVVHTLTVTRAGTGTGSVTSAPAGINCGTDCTEGYAFGTVVTLTAASAVGSNFAGWSGGACTGTGACVVTMNAATTVTATFTVASFALSVTRAGVSGIVVTSSPAGINCPTECSASFAYNTVVTLTASAPDGNAFNGWSGACTGTGACIVTVTQAATAVVTFSAVTQPGWPDSRTRFCTDLTASIACPGGPAGQDGHYEIRVPNYQLVGGRVQDPITGLAWERTPPTTEITHAAAITYCGNLVLDGLDDWRMPNYLELLSIADFGATGPGFPSTAFPGIPSNSYYWTTTDRATSAAQAYGMNTNYPTMGFGTKSDASGRLVRCVRGLQYVGTLVVAGGSITDGRTGLVWQSGTAPTTMTWVNALAYCEALVLDAQSDWRLPNGKELLSIVDPTVVSPSISPLFTSRPATSFWSSSPLQNFPATAYAIHFDFGSSDDIGTNLTQLRSVRCVR